jgi:hypothetical protein
MTILSPQYTSNALLNGEGINGLKKLCYLGINGNIINDEVIDKLQLPNLAELSIGYTVSREENLMRKFDNVSSKLFCDTRF